MRTTIGIILLIAVFFGCKPKDEIITSSPDKTLRFSEDTVTFDTLLSSVGSVTKRFYVYNDDKNAIEISKIEIADLTTPYSITINGIQQNSHDNVLLLGEDSMQVLVEVLIDPMDNSLPYLVKDSVRFTTNGNLQDVKLVAYGQDAHFLSDSILACSATWTNGKPYVIVDSATVPAGCTLTINKGARVLFNYQAKLIVDGTLIVNGDYDSTVTFCNENDLSPEPEQALGYWEGIVFTGSSTGNQISGSIIKNAQTGLYLSSGNTVDSIAELTLNNVIIQDMSRKGVQAYGADVFLENTVITNCIDNLFVGAGGGNYVFTHSSLANYSFDFFRNGSALEFNDSDDENGFTVTNSLELAFYNSVVHGSFDEEIEVSGSSSTYSTNCIFKTDNSVFNGNGNQIDVDPEFADASAKNLRPDTLSPLIDNGNVGFGNAQDLDGNSRDALPDVGAYEYVP